MLGQQKLIAFVATSKAEEALRFYRDVLGLRLVTDDPFAVVFDCEGVTLRIQKTPQHSPLPYTALGWQVQSIEEKVATLRARGVRFERFTGMPQDEQGIWRAPSGARVAWFKDPDGNLLSLSEL